jgi:hypothetical protein
MAEIVFAGGPGGTHQLSACLSLRSAFDRQAQAAQNPTSKLLTLDAAGIDKNLAKRARARATQGPAEFL